MHHNEDSVQCNQYKSSLRFADDLISVVDSQIDLDNKSNNSFKLPEHLLINKQKSSTKIRIEKDVMCRANTKVTQKMLLGLHLELLHGLDNIDDSTEEKRIRCQAYLNIMEQSNDGVRSLTMLFYCLL